MKKKLILNLILTVVLFIIAVLISYAIILNDNNRVSPHNQNAKYMYQNAALYTITLHENTENEISLPDGVYTGSLYTEQSQPFVRPESGTKEEFDSYMKSFAGGRKNNAGYYAVYISGGSVVSAFWSTSSYVINHSAQFAALPLQDTEYWRRTGAEPLVGGYPTVLLREHSLKYSLPEPLDVTVYDMSEKYSGDTKDHSIDSVIFGALPLFLMLWTAVFIKRGIMLLINGTDKKERNE